MAYLEAAKQENFSAETLGVWYSEMLWHGFDAARFRKSVFAVMSNQTFGKVKFEDFLLSSRLYTAGEMNEMVELRIEERKKYHEAQLMGLAMSGEARERKLAEAGLLNVQNYWATELQKALEKHVQRINSKCKRLRAQFYLLPDQAKIDLWSKAVQKGLVRDGDRFAELILPSLVPRMISEFEEAVKNNSVKEQP